MKILGHTDNIVSLLNASGIFVSTSYAEGISNSILEAMACCLPVIITKIPSNEDFMKEINKFGMAIEPGNPQTLAEAIIHLKEYTDLEKLGQNARNFVLKNFTIDHRIKNEYKTYGL